MLFRSVAKAFLSLSGTYFSVFLTWCTMQRWYSVLGKAALIASLIPVRPSAQRIRISFTPLFFSSFSTVSQYLLLSFSPTWMVNTSFLPSWLMPRITYAASLRITLLSFTEKWTASIKRIGYTSARGLFCHSSISGKRRSVISETMPSLTSKP